MFVFQYSHLFAPLQICILKFGKMKSDREEKKEEKERHATALELFYDLVFVAVVSQLAENFDR
jgi:low temperature requirement protein LtrA